MVSRALWRLLRKFSLARTSHEERSRLFTASREAVVGRDSFSASIVRALKASLLLHPKLHGLRLRFVEGGGTELDLSFSKQLNLVLIHSKWLNFQKVHESGPCEVLRLTDAGRAGEEAFFCDHVVEDLFDTLLSKVGSAYRISLLDFRLLRRGVREQLRLMPRSVQVAPTALMNELEVRWIGNEGGLVSTICSSNIRYQVTLHRVSSCRSRWNFVLQLLQTGAYRRQFVLRAWVSAHS